MICLIATAEYSNGPLTQAVLESHQQRLPKQGNCITICFGILHSSGIPSRVCCFVWSISQITRILLRLRKWLRTTLITLSPPRTPLPLSLDLASRPLAHALDARPLHHSTIARVDWIDDTIAMQLIVSASNGFCLSRSVVIQMSSLNHNYLELLTVLSKVITVPKYWPSWEQ